MGVYVEYLVCACVFIMVFSFAWKWIVAVPVTLLQLGLGENTNFLSNVVRALGYFLISTSIVLLSLGMAHEYGYSWVYYLSGFFILLSICISDIAEAAKRCTDEYGNSSGWSEIFLALFCISIYIVSLIIPEIACNKLTLWVYVFLSKIWSLPIIGAIIKFIAVAYVFWYMVSAVIIILTLIGIIVKTFRGEKENVY